MFEFENFVFQCLKALPYLDKPIVEYLMQPTYGSRQRYDVLCAILKGELKIWQFARLPDISLDVALKVYHKIFSEEEQRTIVLLTRNAKYFIVAEGEELGYYLSIEFGHISLFGRPMPVKAKLENEAGLL